MTTLGEPEIIEWGTKCAVHRHRERVPIHKHHIWPKGLGGPTIKANLISICANAHYCTHDLLDQVIDAGSWTAVSWRIRRQYGFGVRRLAKQGWYKVAARPVS